MKNKRKLWFRAKEFGWGWYPVSWQGWTVTLAYSVLIPLSIIIFGIWLGAAVPGGLSARGTLFAIFEFLAFLIVATGILLRLCYRHGERPRWRWGKKK